MIRLRTPLKPPPMNTIAVVSDRVIYGALEAHVEIAVPNVGAVATVWRNGKSIGLRRREDPDNVASVVETLEIDTPDAFDRLLRCKRDPGAVEELALKLGIIGASLTGKVE